MAKKGKTKEEKATVSAVVEGHATEFMEALRIRKSSQDYREGGYQEVDLKKITPSKENYRKTFDKQGMEDLTASVKSKGVLQPILCRPLNGNGTFEIVAGHRRYQAAMNAGLSAIPAIIREYSDEDALEIQVIENTQREDPNPLEEGFGFKALIKIGKHTPVTLAAKLDKSPDYVLRRIKLTELPGDAQKKILSGELSMGHALLLTRLRHPSEQKEFMKMMSNMDLTVRDAQSRMRQFGRDIQDAVFDTAACKTCGYLSSNQSVLFAELKKSGQCMDRGCFFAKTRDYYQDNIIEPKKAEGFKIITDKKNIENLRHSTCHGNMIRIAEKQSWPAQAPKRYKSECLKCKENHAYFLVEGQDYSGAKIVECGEICLNKKCFDAMSKPSAAAEAESSSGQSGSTRMKLRECRDRFLRRILPDRIKESLELKLRIAIYHTLKQFNSEGLQAAIRKYDTTYEDRWRSDQYAAVNKIPADMLAIALTEIVLAALPETDPDAMVQMLAEAEVDLSAEIVLDEEYLKALQKPQLIALGKDLGFKLSVTENSKKGDIVSAILAQNLTGKLPAELAEMFKADKTYAGVDDRYCRVCGMAADEIENDDEPWPEDDLCAICAADKRVCRICGCTTANCKKCIEKTGEPCYWVEDDLCSACAAEAQEKEKNKPEEVGA